MLWTDNQWYFSPGPEERQRPTHGLPGSLLGGETVASTKLHHCPWLVCVGKAWCEWHSLAHSSEFAVTFARILNETKWASVAATLQWHWSHALQPWKKHCPTQFNANMFLKPAAVTSNDCKSRNRLSPSHVDPFELLVRMQSWPGAC